MRSALVSLFARPCMFAHVHMANNFILLSCDTFFSVNETFTIEHYFLGDLKKMKKSLQMKAILIFVVVVASQGVEVLKKGETDLRSLGIKTGCGAERWMV